VSDLAARRSNHALRLAIDAFNQELSLADVENTHRASFDATHTVIENGWT
jgi:hypothetical protein